MWEIIDKQIANASIFLALFKHQFIYLFFLKLMAKPSHTWRGRETLNWSQYIDKQLD